MTFFGTLVFDLFDFLLTQPENKNNTKRSWEKNLFMAYNCIQRYVFIEKK
jgi:hypothetical protein